jgi:pimeloyl-ACP methyl ester carboxylesterase
MPMVAVRLPDGVRTSRMAPPPIPAGPGPEQSRARQPDRDGFVDREGVRIHWEVYGDGEPTILLVPTWTIVTSRIWKPQIPYFARHHRVITFDPRGNGRTDRPADAVAYDEREFGEDIVAILEELGVERAVIVSISAGAQRSIVAASRRPDRVAGLVFIGPSVPLGHPLPGRAIDFNADYGIDEGWTRHNRHSWRRDYHGFLEFFFSNCFTEPHSTKQIEDAVGWGSETDGETLILTNDKPAIGEAESRAMCAEIRCPTLVIQGLDDAITGPSRGTSLAEAIPGARLVTITGGGHLPNARDPVKVNLVIRDFIRSLEAVDRVAR